MLSRRGLITGLISLVAAPAIVRAESLMPVQCFALDAREDLFTWDPEGGRLTYGDLTPTVASELEATLRRLFIPHEVVALYRQNPLLALLLKNVPCRETGNALGRFSVVPPYSHPFGLK